MKRQPGSGIIVAAVMPICIASVINGCSRPAAAPSSFAQSPERWAKTAIEADARFDVTGGGTVGNRGRSGTVNVTYMVHHRAINTDVSLPDVTNLLEVAIGKAVRMTDARTLLEDGKQLQRVVRYETDDSMGTVRYTARVDQVSPASQRNVQLVINVEESPKRRE